MLKKRLLTALILIPVVILIILYAPPSIFAIISGLVFILALGEWPRMAGYKKFPKISEFVKALLFAIFAFFFLALICYAGFYIYSLFFTLPHALEPAQNVSVSHSYLSSIFFPSDASQHGNSISLTTFFVSIPFWASVVASFWIFPLLAVLFYPMGAKYYTRGYISLGIGILTVTIAWFSLIILQASDPRYALYPLFLVWIADTFAYFAGKKFGNLKLAPNISPGKTWEGVFAAVIGGVLFSFGIYMLLNLAIPLTSWLVLTTIVVLMSVVGDLFESIFKRQHQLKDSGNLLPGHGGLLDRIDALLSALPVFAFGFLVILGLMYYSEVPLPAALFFKNF